ncbi:WD40-repeat-containing domain protein [Phlyctochytrium arcticum]|nr:WD40-repeat-containing domain protein [Phlyctochytrium arcticum]
MFAKPKGPPAQKLHTVRRKPRQKDDNQPPLRLDRVLGLTGTRPSALALNPDPDNPLLVYPAGGTIVKYNYRKNKQVGFLCPANTDSDRLGGQSTSYTASRRTGGASNAVKAAACVAYSPDGEYLAVGESGHQPKIIIWKGTTIFSELVGHKYGILAIAFSPDAKYLVSVGFQHDGFAYVWNWRTGQRIAYGRLNTKINSVAFDPKGAFFVTAGTNHIKFWDMDPTKLAAGAKSAKPGNVVLDGILGHMTEHQNSHFVDVACATAPDGDTYTYCVTAEGILMCFNGEWGMERWVDLKVQAGKTITVSETLVICGCTDGIMRVFEQRTLAYVSTLPKPHPIDVELQTSRHARTNAIYPDVEAIAIDTLSTKIFVVYNDHSLFIWDVTDLKHVGKYRSFLWHSDAVWGVELIPSHGSPNRASILPPNAFATHSSDGTVRFWDLGNSNYHNTAGSVSETTDAVSPGGGDPGGSDSSRHNIYSKELIRILYVDRAGILKLKTPQSQPETYSAIDKTGVRALRVTPDGQFLASGDRLGNIRIHELVHFQQLKFLEAHEAEILTIDFAEDPSSDSYLMATASRDRLIHIFDGGRDFELLQTLDDHTSSITSVKFCDSGRRLMSCGADKSVIFRVAEPGGDFHSYHNILGRSTVYDMDIDPLSKYVATASQDRKINVYSITTGKTVRSYRPDSDENGTTEGGFIKLSMDPSGLYMATSASDKTIRIFDFYTGTCVGKISSGHSELVTSVKFTADCQFLVSTAADGCIFVWRVAERMVTQMRSRLNRTSPTLKRSRSASSVAVPAALDNGSTTSMRSSWSSRPESIAPPFLMNESVLPAWARTSIASSTVSSEPVARFVPPKGRWAQVCVCRLWKGRNVLYLLFILLRVNRE